MFNSCDKVFVVPGAYSQIKRPAPFDFTKCIKQVRGGNFLEGRIAQLREDVCFQPVQDVFGMGFRPLPLFGVVPFQRRGLECVLRIADGKALFLLLGLGWVDTLHEELFGRIPRRARFGQRYKRIYANREGLLFSKVAVFQPPVFFAIGFDQKVQAAAIRKLLAFFGRFRAFTRNVSQLHRKVPLAL